MGQEPKSGNKRGSHKVGTKWDQESHFVPTGNKWELVPTKWEQSQEPQSGNKKGTKWEQSGINNPKVGTREEQSGNKVGSRT